MGSHRIVALAMALAAQLLAPVAVAQTPAEMQRMRNADAARRTAIQDENRRATQGAQRSLADTRRTTAEKGARQQAASKAKAKAPAQKKP